MNGPAPSVNTGIVRKREPSEESNELCHSSRERNRRRAIPKRIKPNVPSDHLKVPPPVSKEGFPFIDIESTSHKSNDAIWQLAEVRTSPSMYHDQEMTLRDNAIASIPAFRNLKHRSNCKLGIPVVLKATPEGDFRKTYRKTLYNDILMSAGETPARLNLGSNGVVIIDVL